MNNTTKNPRIKSIFNCIATIEGEYNYRQNQQFYLASNPNVKFIVISATTNKAFMLINSEHVSLDINSELIELNESQNINTSLDYLGKIIDINGGIIWPTNEKKRTNNSMLSNHHPIFGLAHNLMTVKTLNEQLYTGIIAIDLLIPIGKGQRELIIGDRQTGKTHMALNAIINQAKNGTKCIYVAIGQKRESLTNIYETLKKYDALKNTMIIDAPQNVYEQYLAPYIGMAHAENLSYDNDVLIVFDDLTKHANIIREIALLTNKSVGKEAMPSDIFFAHSSLLERAGSFVNRKTITALPILQTVDGDITSLISSNIISITDGQIVTSSDLFASGKLPAINIDLSVSRTGSSVQSRMMTKIAGEINKIFRSYKRHLKLAMLDYELNKETSILLHKGKLIDKMFLQKGFSLYSYRFVVLTTKLISWGVLQGIKDEQKAFMLLDYLINNYNDCIKAFETILDNLDYDDNIMKNYFAFVLKSYSDYLNLNWDIELEHNFVPIPEEQLDKAAKVLGDK